jgi:lipopolysaccharide assembly protein B
VYGLFWLLLPLAAASGWWAARYSDRRRKSASRARLNSAYGQGINYLLNEEPDKATDVLVKLVEVDPETVELHLALGSLFRRRGEVDRAIRVHRNIITRTRLSDALRDQAKLELGRDFLKAGLLDRAEQLLQGLLQQGVYVLETSRHLVEIYQQEKEWRKAIEVAERVTENAGDDWQNRIAHYYCELGEVAVERRAYEEALQLAKRALDTHSGCVRANVLIGAVCQHQGRFAAAIDAYQAVASQNSSLAAEVLSDIQHCRYQIDGTQKDSGESTDVSSIQPIGSVSAGYRCDACGFSGSKLFWQCPGCQRWSSIKPVRLSHAG